MSCRVVGTSSNQEPEGNSQGTGDVAQVQELQHQLNVLKGYTILLEVKLAKEIKLRAFESMKAKAAKFDQEYIESFEDE